MFGEFGGLPVHALVLHAAVIFGPLAALAGIAFLVPGWRSALRWPLVALVAVSVVIVFVAKESGEVLKTALGDQLTGNATGELVARHKELGDRLWIALLVLLALAIVTALTLRPPAPAWFRFVLAPAIAVVAIAVLVLTYQTGEAGAKARWNPDGSFDYSGK